MKNKPVLTNAQITFAKELYVEHGFSTVFIAKELNTRPTTVARYLLANDVDISEIHPDRVQFRQIMLNALKDVGQYFEDLENYNYAFIEKLFREIAEV